MAYTFAVDITKMDELSEFLKNKAEAIPKETEEIYSDIDNMGNAAWQGDSYNAFKTGTDSYKAALGTLPEVVQVFSKTLQDPLKPNAEKAIQEVSEAITEMASE